MDGNHINKLTLHIVNNDDAQQPTALLVLERGRSNHRTSAVEIDNAGGRLEIPESHHDDNNDHEHDPALFLNAAAMAMTRPMGAAAAASDLINSVVAVGASNNHNLHNHNEHVLFDGDDDDDDHDKAVDGDGSKRKHHVIATNSVVPPTNNKRRKPNIDSGINNVVATRMAANKKKKKLEDIIKLEEEIFVLENTMDALTNRKAQVENEQTAIREKLQAAYARLQANVQQRVVLEAALEQHERLQHDLEASLVKIVERLNRILGDDGGGDGALNHHDDDDPQQQEQQLQQLDGISSQVEFDVTAAEGAEYLPSTTTVATTTDQEEEHLLEYMIDSVADNVESTNQHPTVDVTTLPVNPSTAPTTKTKNDEMVLIGHITRPKESDFWKAKRDAFSLMTFLPSIPTVDIICKMMNVRAIEALMWDQVPSPDGRFRLESLWNTCVDFCIMGHIRPATRTTEDASTTNAPVLDPDVTLCPRETYGVCADMFCTYQHLRPTKFPPRPPQEHLALTKATTKVKNTADQKPAARQNKTASQQPLEQGRGIFRNIVELEEQVLKPSEGKAIPATNAPTIDPNVALCPYELTGVCADSMCPYQHLYSRPAVPILPRELLPLPPLKLPPKVGTPLTDDKHEAMLKVGKLRRAQPNKIKAFPNTSTASEPTASADPIVDNDDFVTIPAITILSESDEGSDAEEGLEDWHSRVRHASEASRKFWWMDDDTLSTFDQNLAVDVFECLHHVGGFEVVLGKKKVNKTLRFKGKQLSNPLEVVKFIGRVVDCTRVAIHAGRFDIAKAYFDQGVDLMRKMEQLNVPEKFPKDTAKALRNVLEVLKETSDAAFFYDAHQQNALIAAFENEALLGILSMLIQSFYGHLAKAKQSDRSSEHHESLATLLGRIREAATAEYIRGSPPEGKKGILDYCLALFNPNPVSLSKLQAEDEDRRGSDFRDVRLLLATFLSSRSVYGNLAESADFALHRHEILEAFWKEAKLQLRNSGPDVLQPAIAVGSVIFACIGNIVNTLPDKENLDPSTVASLTTFDKTLYHIVSCLRDDYLKFLFGGIMVSPLIAATTSLAVLLRNYPKAQHRLEDAMAASCHIDQAKIPILVFSELLWSQMIILRSSLPPFDDTAPTNSTGQGPLSGALSDSHQKLADIIISYGVQVNHVTLEGDWNVLAINSQRNLKFVRTGIASILIPNQDFATAESTLSRFEKGFMQNNHLDRLRTIFDRHSHCISNFPQSTFLVGDVIPKLEMIKCFLPDLPLSFGYHFPNLTRLNLRGNALQALPESIGNLTALTMMNLELNKLWRLPDSIGNLTKLEYLNVSFNRLTTLPLTMSKLTELVNFRATRNRFSEFPLGLTSCKNLGVLQVSLNHLYNVTPSLLMQYFPNLHDLKLHPCRREGVYDDDEAAEMMMLMDPSSEAAEPLEAANNDASPKPLSNKALKKKQQAEKRKAAGVMKKVIRKAQQQSGPNNRKPNVERKKPV